MLPPLRHPVVIFLTFSLVMGFICSTTAGPATPVFQESLSWAREQAAKIKDQIAGVDTSFSTVHDKSHEQLKNVQTKNGAKGDKDQDEQGQEVSPACRPTFGNLSPCDKKGTVPDQNHEHQQGYDKLDFGGKTSTSSSEQRISGKILIFISLSMPEESLKSLAQEAERNHSGPVRVVLVLRGLVKDSFKETAQVLQTLGLSAEINPEAFDRYRINQVPTFVWVDDNDQEQARLKGNVTLDFAQQKFQDVL